MTTTNMLLHGVSLADGALRKAEACEREMRQLTLLASDAERAGDTIAAMAYLNEAASKEEQVLAYLEFGFRREQEAAVPKVEKQNKKHKKLVLRDRR